MTSFTRPYKDWNIKRPEVEPESAPTDVTLSLMCGLPRMNVCNPKGFLPFLVYVCAIGALPLCYQFGTYDITDNMDRGIIIGVSAAACVVLMLAKAVHQAVWYNMALFYHIGIEAYAVKLLLDNYEASVPETEQVLSLIAVCVIIAHLVPFLLVDRASVLSLLATAGVLVNVSAFVFVEGGDSLDLIAPSALNLLAFTLAFRECESLSMLSQLRIALKDRMCLLC